KPCMRHLAINDTYESYLATMHYLASIQMDGHFLTLEIKFLNNYHDGRMHFSFFKINLWQSHHFN
ncbi:hypothetical protein ACJX0J_034485, partial [Zea mays]